MVLEHDSWLSLWLSSPRNKKKKIILISSIFRTKKSLPKEEKQREEEEGPCTSYSQKESKHERCLDHQVLDQYLSEYKSHFIAFRGATTFPQFIQQKEERRSYGKREIKGNRFLLSTFDGDTLARAWVKKLEAFFLLHQVVEKEEVEIAALHMEGEAFVWWIKPLVHSRVSSFTEFSQRLIQTFDGERTKEEKFIPPGEEDCTNDVTTLEEQPSTSMDEAAIALEETTTETTQEDPKVHQFMSEVPLFISANNLRECGNSPVEVQGSTHFAMLEHHDYTTL